MNDSSILTALDQLKKEVNSNISIVAVSKTKPESAVLEAYNVGHLDFGENKVQEVVRKNESLPKDIRWHFIGHLQRNKVKNIAPFVHLIHSVDSLKLLKEIDKRAASNSRQINCLLQISIAEEESKFGLSPELLHQLLDSEDYSNLQNIKVIGLMGMATNTKDEGTIRAEFSMLKNIFDATKKDHFLDSDSFNTLSMGMTSDFKLAIDEGSNMIRVGSLIFGERNKP